MTVFSDIEKNIYSIISRHDGIKASRIASDLHVERKEVNRCLYLSALMRELCYCDKEHYWYALIADRRPYSALWDFCAFYGAVSEFSACSEAEFMERMLDGCAKIGRSLDDHRGLFHSFRDCRSTLIQLFEDIAFLTDGRVDTAKWEIAFEMRFNRAKYIRVYADTVLVTDRTVFVFEFKMKKVIEEEEANQACKYVPYLEIIFGSRMRVVPVLVLTAAKELFCTYTACDGNGQRRQLTVCSGDMLFNALDNEMRFLLQ